MPLGARGLFYHTYLPSDHMSSWGNQSNFPSPRPSSGLANKLENEFENTGRKEDKISLCLAGYYGIGGGRVFLLLS